ncbi:MAG: peroxiredoxin [Planctomyces sp.]|nr:peroxiredoxin [Planctomyces sp.]
MPLHTRRTLLLLPLLACLAVAGPLAGEDAPKPLKVGDAAPEFTVKDDADKDWKSSEHFGKKLVVVYFYPADMTGGCTKQACGFRDNIQKLKDKGVEVVGVSGDSVRNHQLFKQAHDLNFTLLADEDGKVAEKFGVPLTREEKSVTATIDGKEEVLTRKVTTNRWTFIVDEDQQIAYRDENVNAAEDSEAVLKAVEALRR